LAQANYNHTLWKTSENQTFWPSSFFFPFSLKFSLFRQKTMPARMMMSCALLVQGNQEIAPFMAPVWEENTGDLQLRQLADEPAAPAQDAAAPAAPAQNSAADQQNPAPQPQPREGGEEQGNDAADPPAAPAQEAEKPEGKEEKKTDSAWALSAIVPLMMTMLQW